MTDNAWNPWKMAAIGMALVIVTGLATGLVVANWSGREADRRTATSSGLARPARMVSPVPTQAAINTCNQYAAAQIGQRDKTTEVVKDAAVGAGGGTLYGLNENHKQDERYREAYARCMRTRGYTG